MSHLFAWVGSFSEDTVNPLSWPVGFFSWENWIDAGKQWSAHIFCEGTDSVLGFVAHVTSVTAADFCCWSARAALDNTPTETVFK